MQPSDLAILVMAGGLSRRFSEDDKLLADLDGRPLGLHTATRLSELAWAQKLAVVHPSLSGAFTRLGYRVLAPKPGNGLGDNLALGAGALENVSAALIVLADMPFVTVAHIDALLEAASSPAAIACTETNGSLMPPVLIGRDYFAALQTLRGEQGAKRIFAEAGSALIRVPADVAITVDIDTLADYEQVRRDRATGPRNPA